MGMITKIKIKYQSFCLKRIRKRLKILLKEWI
jgi:hypothetical protein